MVSLLLQEQLDYYRARSAEYDQWWWRQGRYDRGPENTAQWRAETEEVRQALIAFQPAGRVLDLACGTGLWSAVLLPFAKQLTVLDGSAEMLALHEARLPGKGVERILADVFSWQPDQVFDTIFFGFWLSHVPPDCFEAFWQIIDRALAPGGRVFFVDSRHEPTSVARDHQLPPPDRSTLTRKLNDGREFRIYKVFHEPEVLTDKLAALGWDFKIETTQRFFLSGHGRRKLG